MKKLSTLLLIAAVAAGIDANAAEVTRIAAGNHTMLLTKDGKIYVSGNNDAGQLGDGHYFDSEISDNHSLQLLCHRLRRRSLCLGSECLRTIGIGQRRNIQRHLHADKGGRCQMGGGERPLDNNSRYSYRRHIVGLGKEPHRTTRCWRRQRDERVRDDS